MGRIGPPRRRSIDLRPPRDERERAGEGPPSERRPTRRCRLGRSQATVPIASALAVVDGAQPVRRRPPRGGQDDRYEGLQWSRGLLLMRMARLPRGHAETRARSPGRGRDLRLGDCRGDHSARDLLARDPVSQDVLRNPGERGVRTGSAERFAACATLCVSWPETPPHPGGLAAAGLPVRAKLEGMLPEQQARNPPDGSAGPAVVPIDGTRDSG